MRGPFAQVGLWIGVACCLLIAHGAVLAATKGPGKHSKSTSVSASGRLDINHATVQELETLPGIGEAWAEKIVKNRPYANKTQLSSRKILSAAAYARIKSLIIAKQ